MAPSTNHAAFCPAPGKHLPFTVSPAPYTQPCAGELVIRTHALAVNPVDHMLPDFGTFMFTHIKYPAVFGFDVSGEVVEVGKGVTRFHVGDRVVGCAFGADKERNRNAEGGFQEYVVTMAEHTSPIPDSLSYEQAAVIPLGLSTAAAALFQKDQLALPYPPSNGAQAEEKKKKNETLLIWGGSTSVGSNAIQLATAAGYDVITTCSPRNNSYCQSLGAGACFDYNSPTCVADIAKAFQGKLCAGAVAIGNGGVDRCMDVLARTDQVKMKANRKRFIAMVSFTFPTPMPKSFVFPRFIAWMIYWNSAMAIKG
ncbi:hypothetical protein BAUCODRAFT_120648 [Baudoinia panamericana UAMH 10762]|uniref:Enoyl reductase (ER) domain-containing protein n=1 Tax=Baudoinia panamericana (strain UAMH 10762) TaxID=717646 RepID=M2LXF5_BAUPA|nr:uncharacterized protein BAUCODRAFT_120648 [Baudoinia panamericana UAMH 10762]EMC99382.1 hypothetical protein BAUCODRAFT_120648 [Baudoinia panamericana UAMH 10762]